MVIVRLEIFVIWRSTWRANAFTGWNLPWCKKLSGAHKGKQNPVFFCYGYGQIIGNIFLIKNLTNIDI